MSGWIGECLPNELLCPRVILRRFSSNLQAARSSSSLRVCAWSALKCCCAKRVCRFTKYQRWSDIRIRFILREFLRKKLACRRGSFGDLERGSGADYRLSTANHLLKRLPPSSIVGERRDEAREFTIGADGLIQDIGSTSSIQGMWKRTHRLLFRSNRSIELYCGAVYQWA